MKSGAIGLVGFLLLVTSVVSLSYVDDVFAAGPSKKLFVSAVTSDGVSIKLLSCPVAISNSGSGSGFTVGSGVVHLDFPTSATEVIELICMAEGGLSYTNTETDEIPDILLGSHGPTKITVTVS